MNGVGERDRAGAGAGTETGKGVKANEGAQGGNGDGAGAGTGAEVESRGRTQDGNGDGRGDGNESAKRVQASPTSSTSFGVQAEPPALSRRDSVLVNNGAATPKACLSPLEMRTPTVSGGLLPVGKVSTTTRTSYN